MSRRFALLVIPREEELESDDEMHLDEVAALRYELEDAGVTVVEARADGAKGAEVLPFIETVITGGAGLATIGLVAREWIRRRGRRTIELVLKDGERNVSVTVTGKNVTDETLMKTLKDVVDD
jgi:cob(I)alamin adenosyltransferase